VLLPSLYIIPTTVGFPNLACLSTPTDNNNFDRNQPLRPQITDVLRTNCHKKINNTSTEDAALPSLLAELWKPLIHPIEERVFVTDKGERFEISETQMRWKKPLGKKVVLIDTDTRLDANNENSMLNECPLHYPTLPGRTGGHLNHYLYGIVIDTLKR
jgi:hypothetical protein